MTTGGCDLSNIGLNNQLLVSKRIHDKTRNNTGLGRCFDMATSTLDVRNPPSPVSDCKNSLVLLPDDYNNVDGRMICDEPKLSKEEPQETRHLKDLLLLHLDWIQQQQEALLDRDRQIQRLKQEKDILKCRLERMERRMELLRQKNNASPSPKANEQTQSKVRTASPATSSSQSDVQGRGSKRKLSFEPHDLSKKFDAVDQLKPPKVEMLNKSTSTDNDGINTLTPKKAKHRTGRTRRSFGKPTHLFSQQPPRKCRSQLSAEQSAGEDSDAKTVSSHAQEHDSEANSEVNILEQSSQKEENQQDDGLHRTSIMYCVCNVTPLPPCEISPIKEQPEEVKVPTFRIRHVPTGYQLEGTENLTDEAFLKRHQKPEADEKRRKRWDAQMLREQKMLERLQRRDRVLTVVKNGCTSMTRRQQLREEIQSFLPDPQNAKYIEICEEIPVNVFGYALPQLKACEFSLPWYDSEKQLRDERRSTGSSRGHRK